MNNEIDLISTGAAGGIPLLVVIVRFVAAAREDNQLQRQPASALIEVNNQTILIDAGLMQLAEQFSAQSLDAILLTHFHPDHARFVSYPLGPDSSIPVYCPPDKEGCADLLKHPGILNFTLQFENINSGKKGIFTITPLPLIHSKLTYGYLINYQKSIARI